MDEDPKSEYEIALEQTGVEFDYPKDEPAPAHEDPLNFIREFSLHLLASHEPKSELLCALYLTRFDVASLIGARNNTVKGIAEKLGIRKQTLYAKVMRTARKLGVDYHERTRGKRVGPKTSQQELIRDIQSKDVKDYKRRLIALN